MKSALECNPHSNVIRNFWEKKKKKSADCFRVNWVYITQHTNKCHETFLKKYNTFVHRYSYSKQNQNVNTGNFILRYVSISNLESTIKFSFLIIFNSFPVNFLYMQPICVDVCNLCLLCSSHLMSRFLFTCW